MKLKIAITVASMALMTTPWALAEEPKPESESDQPEIQVAAQKDDMTEASELAETAAQTAATDITVETGDPAAAGDGTRVSEHLRHKDRASSVMSVALDGSSIETFTAGLEKLDAEASEKEYREVMSALDFLLFYDLGARRDKATLYQRLSGKSPQQILDRVGKLRKNKHD